MTEISEQVKVADGIVRYRFGDNAELMGACASAHSVVGPFRSHTEPQAGSGETPGTEKAAKVLTPLTYATRRGGWMVIHRAFGAGDAAVERPDDLVY